MTRAHFRPACQKGLPENHEIPLSCSFRSKPSADLDFLGPRTEDCCASCPRSVKWTWSSFNDLPAALLYDILRLRQDIFIVEQNVPYPDIDGRDLQSMHLFGTLGGEVVAYLRALPSGLFEPGYSSFGRVVIKERMRGQGLGRELVKRCMDYFDRDKNRAPIKISSQLYLKDFYSSFDFVPIGNPYIEDRIPHIAMIRS